MAEAAWLVADGAGLHSTTRSSGIAERTRLPTFERDEAEEEGRFWSVVAFCLIVGLLIPLEGEGSGHARRRAKLKHDACPQLRYRHRCAKS